MDSGELLDFYIDLEKTFPIESVEDPFEEEAFDHVFVCFVLEHLQDPVGALSCLKKVLKRNGSITAIEGDHGSWYCYPESPEARRTVQCLIEEQADLGGDSLAALGILAALEQDFEIDIPDEEALKITSFMTAVEVVRKHTN